MHRNRLKVVFWGAALAAGLAASAVPAQQNAKIAHTNLKAGQEAPDFTLLDNHWKQVKLSDYRGKKNVVLAFYVLAFTGG
jgi:cytochrome oxidase Cu insertion factor (SCO1/SenC/PrrC family)